MISQREAGQQEGFGGADQIDHITPAASPGSVVFFVVDQRVGDQAQRFIKDYQREQIGGKSPAHSGGERHCKSSEKPGLVLFLQTAHIADGIERREDPQQARNGGEHHAERIDPEGEINAGQDFKQGQFRGVSRQHRWGQRYHDEEFKQGRDQRYHVAGIRAAVQQQDQRGRSEGHCDRQNRSYRQ